jgi:pSer/pThr/pTyr-binding forkhead associated (FHA) protein
VANPLAATHVALSINIFDQTQHALVRKHLTVERLIADILREFAQELDLNRKYILLYDGRQLDNEMVVGEGNFDPDTALTFGYYEPVRATPAAEAPRRTQSLSAVTLSPQAGRPAATLREVESGQRFAVRRDQTIIGRGGGGERIDVDLAPLRDGRTVSRPHARITAAGEGYTIEPLKEDRPVYVNNEEVPFGRPRRLNTNDVVGVGKVQLVFELV